MGSLEKLQTGTVVSTKMDKTVVVRVDRSKRHRLYRKTIHTSERYKAHDETNACNLGDVVRIAETRPLSRDKRWRVVDIVQKGDVAEVAPTEVGTSQLSELQRTQAAEAARRAELERAEAAARAATKEAEDEAAAAAAPAEEAAPAGDDTPVAESDTETVAAEPAAETAESVADAAEEEQS
jgi:small subunit ribosomal protein S17